MEDKGAHCFKLSARRPTANEKKKWPGVIVMKSCPNPDVHSYYHREILVPMIGLRALKHVLYQTVVRLILEANQGTQITYADMQGLWDAIVHNCYHFVCSCEREAKAMEVYVPSLGFS